MKNRLKQYFSLIKDRPDLFRNENAAFNIILDSEIIEQWEIRKKDTLEKNGKPKKWADIGILLSDPYIVVLRDLVEFPNKEMNGYFRIINRADFDGSKSVVVMPVYDKKILLLKQFRHATRSWHLELPRGFGESHISVEENAMKEIHDEIDGVVSELIDLGPYHDNTGAIGGEVRLFFARLDSYGEPNELEGINEVKPTEIKEFENNIRDGNITDGFTIGAYARAKLRNLI